MFTKEDIIARLKNGDSIDAIANEISDTLNEAKEEYAIQKEEKVKNNAIREAKLCAAEAIIVDLCDFAYASRDDKALEMFRRFTPEEMVTALDNTIGLFNAMVDLEDILDATDQEETDKVKIGSLLDFIFGKR